MPLLLDFYHIDPSKYLLRLLVPSVVELFHDKSCKTYIIMSQSLVKAITNAILFPASPLSYKSPQNIIAEDDGWIIIEHVLCKISPNIGGKVENMQE